MRLHPKASGAVVALALVVSAVSCGAAQSGKSGATTTASAATPIAPPRSAAVSGKSRWWVPSLGDQPWQWEIDHALDVSSVGDLGTAARLPDGAAAPPPVIYDIDGFGNPASTVAALHGRHAHVVCYIEVGAAESYRPDYGEFLASALGHEVPDYPQERYLDIRNPTVTSIIEARIAMCASKGFDAVETDIDESYGDTTGFPLTQTIEVQYMTRLANYMHSLDLGWWIKNPDDTGDNYATVMEPLADAVLTEQCNQAASCGLLAAYRGKKAVFNAEYAPETTAEFCSVDNAADFNGAVFNIDLNGPRRPCR